MCKSGAPFLCCGKSNRHRCVPFTSLIHASAPEGALAGACASARPAPNIVMPPAVPSIRARKPRRLPVSSLLMQFLLSACGARSRHLHGVDDSPDELVGYL